MEIWKNLNNYEGLYEVSSYGRIRSLDHVVPCKGTNATRLVRGKVKKLCLNARGYQITTLSKNNVLHTLTVHQAVAQAFIPDFLKGTEINHIDGCKTNNFASNLEVSNPEHNQFHALRTKLRPIRGTSQYRNVSYVKNPRAISKWAASIRHNGINSFGWKTFKTELEAAMYVDELLDSINDTNRLRNFP
jgi:hypothetical protein